MRLGLHRDCERGAVVQSAERVEIHIHVPTGSFRRKAGQPTGDGEVTSKERAR
jgi:hypothetical protein